MSADKIKYKKINDVQLIFFNVFKDNFKIRNQILEGCLKDKSLFQILEYFEELKLLSLDRICQIIKEVNQHHLDNFRYVNEKIESFSEEIFT